MRQSRLKKIIVYMVVFSAAPRASSSTVFVGDIINTIHKFQCGLSVVWVVCLGRRPTSLPCQTRPSLRDLSCRSCLRVCLCLSPSGRPAPCTSPASRPLSASTWFQLPGATSLREAREESAGRSEEGSCSLSGVIGEGSGWG